MLDDHLHFLTAHHDVLVPEMAGVAINRYSLGLEFGCDGADLGEIIEHGLDLGEHLNVRTFHCNFHSRLMF